MAMKWRKVSCLACAYRLMYGGKDRCSHHTCPVSECEACEHFKLQDDGFRSIFWTGVRKAMDAACWRTYGH